MGEVVEMPSPLPTVHEAWSAVMADVQGISKRERNTGQGFSFRGIDTVLNTVGPVLRDHKVSVIPVRAESESERYTTKSGGQMVGRSVVVTFEVFGPQGDSFFGQVAAEASDSGDKATAKAMSVALRTFFLQALCIPTDEPDPDATSHERANDQVGRAPSEADAMRDRLKELANERGWSLRQVADKFAEHNPGRELKTASADEVSAFGKLLKEGLVTL